MPMTPNSGRSTFGLLPEPEGRSRSFIVSIAVNGLILAAVLYIGMTAKKVMDQHRYEQTLLILPTEPPPPPTKVKIPPPPKLEAPKRAELTLEAPKINMPRPEPKPELKPIQVEAKLTVPNIKVAKPSVILAPQPKAALAAAAMPAQVPQARPSTAPVHLGQTFGVTPNPNATRPATIAAIGNPYGGIQGPAVAPHGVVGSTGIGNGTKSGSNSSVVGRVASAGIPGTNAPVPQRGIVGTVAPTSIPAITAATVAPKMVAAPVATNLEVLSKPAAEYTYEAKSLKVQGDVILRVTFTANGQVLVQGIVHGLGHGLDEEARRVAQRIRFRPATRNGQAVDITTNITITFQLA